jgi:hypothetical protein
MQTKQQMIAAHEQVVAKSQAEREAVNQAYYDWRDANWDASEESFAERQAAWDRLDAAAEIAEAEFEARLAGLGA